MADYSDDVGYRATDRHQVAIFVPGSARLPRAGSLAARPLTDLRLEIDSSALDRRCRSDHGQLPAERWISSSFSQPLGVPTIARCAHAGPRWRISGGIFLLFLWSDSAARSPAERLAAAYVRARYRLFTG